MSFPPKPNISGNTIKVKVQQGWLEGYAVNKVVGDGTYYSFKGIPYADAPIGKLRFKAPQPLQSWEGVRKAMKHGPMCIHRDTFTGLILGDEDCLYLNVYTPNVTAENLKPVIFFIHGGGFRSGSGNDNDYGPDFLMSHDIVLVTINYRLDALGFLCLDTEDVPGNAGLKDQVAALIWVKQNIKVFGGDPDNVTIMGESAGGTSVCLHMLSPLSKGLFKRVISMSGVPFCDWSYAFEPKKRAFVLGRELGMDTDDPDKLLSYLQNVPVEKIVDTKPCLLMYEEKMKSNPLKMLYYTPVIERDFGQNHFLTQDPEDIMKKGNVHKVDLLMGYTANECLIALPFIEDYLMQEYEKYPELLVPTRVLFKCSPEQSLSLSDLIRSHYFGTKIVNLQYIEEFLNYLNDVSFIYPIHEFMRKMPEFDNFTRYMYRFNCMSNRNIYGKRENKYKLDAPTHLDDMAYLFDPKHANLKLKKESKEHQMIELVCKVFTNFAKYGNPTPDSDLIIIVPEYRNNNTKHMEIGEVLSVGSEPIKEKKIFWDGIYNHAFGNDK